jgi:hypothetical protein
MTYNEASCAVTQVTTLMWMRTTMNFQYRYGTSTTQGSGFNMPYKDVTYTAVFSVQEQLCSLLDENYKIF